jgi:hypothetical protein
MKISHPHVVSSMKLMPSGQPPQMSGTLSASVGSSDTTLHTQSENKCKFQLLTPPNQSQDSKAMKQVDVKELSPAVDTESDSSIEAETFNISFSKEVPLDVRSEARNHRSSVHMQPEFDLIQFFPEILPWQSTDILNSTYSYLPVDRCIHKNVSEVDCLPPQVYIETSEPVVEPRMVTETNSPLMQLREVLSNKDTGLLASQLESGDKHISDTVNPEKLMIVPKESQIISSGFTDAAVTKGGVHFDDLETTGEQILSEVSVQDKISDETAKFEFHSELKNEVQAAPVLKTHVNILSVLPHEETVIELLPRKHTGKICADNEVEVKSEQGTGNNISENCADFINVCDAVQPADLINLFTEPESARKLDEKKVVSLASVPHSVEQRDVTKNSDVYEDGSDTLYDYQWAGNCPDEPFVQATDDMLPMSSGHLESEICRDSEWLNMWPIDSVIQISDSSKESECMVFPTDWHIDPFISSYAHSDRNSLEMPNHASEFDDDIETNLFDEDNPRHSLHELEETVSQLVSDVEMDESQLLKNLSCLESAVIKHSQSNEAVVLQNDNLESEKTVSNTASTKYESSQKQEPFEDSKPIRAEVKVLVKTSDTGKEVIEIRSMREYLDTEVTLGRLDTPSVFRADLKPSIGMSKNIEEHENVPQKLELPEKHVPLKFPQSSSGFRIDKNVRLSHELLQNDIPKTNMFQNVHTENGMSKNSECVPPVHDLNKTYSSILPEHQQHLIQKLFVLPYDRLLDDSAVQKPKMYKERQRKHTHKAYEQQEFCCEDQQHEQYWSTKQSHKYRQKQETGRELKEFESSDLEMNVEDNRENAKLSPEIQNIKHTEDTKEPQKVCKAGTDGKCQKVMGHQQSVIGQTQIFQELKEEEKFPTIHPGGQHRNLKEKPKSEQKREDRQFHQIQRLFIRSPDFTLSEPLNMLSSEISNKKQSAAVKEQSQHIKKLLVRSADFEDHVTFPVITPPSSLPTDLRPLSITPSPPPQQLPKTKLFENLSKVRLGSEEDLQPVSPFSLNSSPQNLFFSFLPMDDMSDMSGESNIYPSLTGWLSMPSLVMEPVGPSSSTIPVNGTTLSSCLTRVASMPSLQDPISSLHIPHNESSLSSSHRTDEVPKAWATLLDDGNETSLIMQHFPYTSQTSSPSLLPLSTIPRQDTLTPFWQQNSSSHLSPGSTRRHCGKTFFSSPSSTFSSHYSETAIASRSPICSRHLGRNFPGILNSSSSHYVPKPIVKSLPKSPVRLRKHRNNHMSHMNTLTCFQPPSSNMQGILDPWYLQTDFLLSPVVIPSGYCTWVPTPDQQMYSRGKEGADFKILSL